MMNYKKIMSFLMVVFLTQIVLTSEIGLGNRCSYAAGSFKNSSILLSNSVMYKFSGYVLPDLDSDYPYIRSNFEIEIYKINQDGNLKELQASVYSDSEGFFEIRFKPSVSANYTVEVNKYGFLRRMLTNNSIVVKSDISFGTQSNPILIWAGDVNGNNVQDGAINMLDVVSEAEYYNSSMNDKRYIEKNDLNKDYIINMSDIMILAAHFNKTTDSYAAVTAVSSESDFFVEDGGDYYTSAKKQLQIGVDLQGKMDYDDDFDFFLFSPPSSGYYRFDFYLDVGINGGYLYEINGNTYTRFQTILNGSACFAQEYLEYGKKYCIGICGFNGSVFSPDVYRIRVSRIT